VLPLTFGEGQTARSLCLDGTERFDIEVPQTLSPRQAIRVTAHKADGSRSIGFDAICRIDTPVEIEYYRNGGILQTVLRRLMK
jgi:aconitate hydratase